jgi:hypothetical protein
LRGNFGNFLRALLPIFIGEASLRARQTERLPNYFEIWSCRVQLINVLLTKAAPGDVVTVSSTRLIVRLGEQNQHPFPRRASEEKRKEWKLYSHTLRVQKRSCRSSKYIFTLIHTYKVHYYYCDAERWREGLFKIHKTLRFRPSMRVNRHRTI